MNKNFTPGQQVRIKVNGVSYLLNAEVAEAFGLLRKEREDITDFKVGDVFTFPTGTCSNVVILQSEYSVYPSNARFVLGGNGSVLKLFSPPPCSKPELLKWLNENKAVLAGNVNFPF